MLTGKTRNEASSSSKLVVIADAHELLRESMRSMLSHEPDLLIIDEARDGREAIELCREHRPDLVLMEASMPTMTGLEATRAIKEEFPGTKVLIVSAYESVAFVSEAVTAGAEGYVSKLAPLQELLEAVRGVLRGEFDTLEFPRRPLLGSSVNRGNERQPPVPMGKVTAPVEGGNLRRGPYYSFSSSSGRRMLFLATILKKMLGLSRMSLAAISTTAIPLTSHLSSPASFSALTADSTTLLLIDRGSAS